MLTSLDFPDFLSFNIEVDVAVFSCAQFKTLIKLMTECKVKVSLSIYKEASRTAIHKCFTCI